MEKQNFTRQEVLDIITEIDDKGIDSEAITYNQILDTIVNKLGQNKQLIIPSVGCSYFTASDIGSKFEIVKESLDHDFELGETVTLECVSLAEDDQYKFSSDKDYWWCGFDDVERL